MVNLYDISMARSVAKIKKKYGETAFKRWGKAGGNPVCLAQGRGDRIIIVKKKRKS